jgi:hypothetical protein
MVINERNIAGELHVLIEEIAPIISVRIGNPDDKETWEIVFADEATASQKNAAKKILKDFI